MPYDAVIVGGSYAGLSAALILARSRRRVLVIDAGHPRNRFADQSHGVLARDGSTGADLLANARTQLSAYPNATLMTGEAVHVASENGGFVVRLADGGVAEGRRIVLATGLVDILPELPGLIPRWGKTVLHCPYCHGYEVGGGTIGVLATAPRSLRQALKLTDWGDVVLFTNETIDLDAQALRLLAVRNVTIEPIPVTALEGPDTALAGARLADGRLTPLKALFLSPSIRMASPLAEQIGCAFDPISAGAVIRTDPERLTTVPGVYAAGDAARAGDITMASAGGVTAGAGVHDSLIDEDLSR